MRAGFVSTGAVHAAGPARRTVGLVMAPRGQLFLVLAFRIAGDKITAIEVIAGAARLRQLDLAVLDG